MRTISVIDGKAAGIFGDLDRGVSTDAVAAAQTRARQSQGLQADQDPALARADSER